MPLKPSPKAAAMTNRPTSSCVSRKQADGHRLEGRAHHHRPQPADAVRQRAPRLARDEGRTPASPTA